MAHLWWRIDRRALLVTAMGIVAWRLLYQVPILGLAPDFITNRLQSLSTPGFFPAIGGSSIAFASYSLGTLGVQPYVYAILVVYLLRIVSRRLNAVAFDLPRIERWTRALALGFAMLQAYSFTLFDQVAGALPAMGWFERLAICLEMTAGTAVALLIASAIDEFGLGFGNAAFFMYALAPLATGFHRLSDFVAVSPSTEAMYRPFVLWAAIAVLTIAVSVTILLAGRLIPISGEAHPRTDISTLRLVASGVMRPPLFAGFVLALPGIVVSYLSPTDVQFATWMTEHWTPFGTNVVTDAAYVVVWIALIVLFAEFVVQVDVRLLAGSQASIRPEAVPHLARLGLIGGACLALIVVGAPLAAHFLTRADNTAIGATGAGALVLTALVLTMVLMLERRIAAAATLKPPPAYIP